MEHVYLFIYLYNECILVQFEHMPRSDPCLTLNYDETLPKGMTP